MQHFKEGNKIFLESRENSFLQIDVKIIAEKLTMQNNF